MFKPRSPLDELLFSTIRIETELGNGIRVGTAFFLNFRMDDKSILPVIITNKHVVENAKKGRFLIHEGITSSTEGWPSDKSFTFEVDNFEHRWTFHPDKNIDLCCMPALQLRQMVEKENRLTYTVGFGEELILSDDKLAELSAIEEILMIGYPNGLWDDLNNLPIVRRGITATHPAMNFRGKHEFLIDAASFPGSSGSPVILITGGRLALLGVLYAVPVYDAKGDIVIVDIPTANGVQSITQMMLHLGYVIKAKELLVLKQEVVKLIKK